jgi:hypothetical protein
VCRKSKFEVPPGVIETVFLALPSPKSKSTDPEKNAAFENPGSGSNNSERSMVAASPAKIEPGLTEKVGVTGAAASGCEKPIAPMMAAAKSAEKIDLIIAPRPRRNLTTT